jgi:hypothetical protein
MKKLVLALLFVAVAAVPDVEAEYIGTFNSQSPYNIEVVSTTIVSVTILSVTRGRLEVEELIVTQPNVSQSTVKQIPPKAERMIIKVDSAQNGQGVVQVRQGTNIHEINVGDSVGTPHTEIVFDVGP